VGQKSDEYDAGILAKPENLRYYDGMLLLIEKDGLFLSMRKVLFLRTQSDANLSDPLMYAPDSHSTNTY
jgi:hypothetical protein